MRRTWAEREASRKPTVHRTLVGVDDADESDTREWLGRYEDRIGAPNADAAIRKLLSQVCPDLQHPRTQRHEIFPSLPGKKT